MIGIFEVSPITYNSARPRLILKPGRCGDIDDSRSIEIPMSRPGGVFPYYFGLYFDVDTWDGSDFFMPEGRGWKFVVEDVKRAFEKAKIKNVTFEKLVDVERMRGATSL